MKLKLKVVPGASRDSLEWLDAEQSILKIRVTAPPEKGRANRAVEKYLADVLGIAGNRVTITSGTASAHKVAEITGLGEAEVLARLPPRGK